MKEKFRVEGGLASFTKKGGNKVERLVANSQTGDRLVLNSKGEERGRRRITNKQRIELLKDTKFTSSDQRQRKKKKEAKIRKTGRSHPPSGNHEKYGREQRGSQRTADVDHWGNSWSNPNEWVLIEETAELR